MTIKRRVEKLEEKAGVRKELTLEELVSAANGDIEAMRRVEEAEARGDDPLIMSIHETCKRGKIPETGHGD